MRFATIRTSAGARLPVRGTAGSVDVAEAPAFARGACASGDVVLADGDGVVVVPARDAQAVLRQAELIDRWELERRAVLTADPARST